MPRPKSTQTEEKEIENPEQTISEQKIEPKPIFISAVQPYDNNDNIVAWFILEDGSKIFKRVDYCGIISDVERKESVPTVLILTNDGTLLPPFMIAGFIGMLPENYEFPPEPEPELQPQPEEEHIQAKGGVQGDASKSESEPEPERQIVAPQPEPPKKKGIMGIFKKGKKPEPEQPKEISKETTDMISKLTDVSK